MIYHRDPLVTYGTWIKNKLILSDKEHTNTGIVFCRGKTTLAQLRINMLAHVQWIGPVICV